MPPSDLLSQLPPISASHPAVRHYVRARRNQLPRTDRQIAVCGRWAHDQLLVAGASPEVFLWCPGDRSRTTNDTLARAESLAGRAAAAYVISERTLRRIDAGLRAPAMLSIVSLPASGRSDLLACGARLVVVADGIEYAGNLGTLIRTADACGASGVLVTRPDARITHPKVFTASRGSVLTMPTWEYASVESARADLAAAGFRTYLADPAAPVAYRDADFAVGRVAVVVGSEGSGVSTDWLAANTVRISIPMNGRVDSLNVATAAAILLFEVRAQLDARSPVDASTASRTLDP